MTKSLDVYAAEMQRLSETVVINPGIELLDLPGNFNFGKPEYFVPDSTLTSFDRLLDDLGTSLKLSAKSFRAEATTAIVSNIIARSDWNRGSWKAWIDGLRAKPLVLNTTYVSVSGVTVRSRRPMQLGPYMVFALPRHKKALFMQYPELKGNQLKMFSDLVEDTSCLLSFSSEGQDQEFSEQLSLGNLNDFAPIIHFMVGHSRSLKDIDLFELDKRAQKRLTLSQTQGKFGTTRPTVERHDIELGKYFLSKRAGNDKIWDLVASDTRNELQDAIVMAIKWIGKAAADQDLSRAFIQCVFAIESLLVLSDGFVTPSIAQQVREGCAFLLSADPLQRQKIDADIPKLYRIRSQVVHGAGVAASPEDVSRVYQIARQLVYRIIKHTQFARWSKTADVADWIKRYKYNSRKSPV